MPLQKTDEHPANASGVALATPEEMQPTIASKIATVAAIGIGAALIEAELIPGILLGVAAMLAPDLLPKIGRGMRPFIKGAVRAGYSVAERTKETIAEATEQFQDIVAEVKSEQPAQLHGNGSSPTHT